MVYIFKILLPLNSPVTLSKFYTHHIYKRQLAVVSLPLVLQELCSARAWVCCVLSLSQSAENLQL